MRDCGFKCGGTVALVCEKAGNRVADMVARLWKDGVCNMETVRKEGGSKVAGFMREAFLQDTFKAWEEYRTTGLHVTADEADVWLAQLEQGNDIEPPECHV